MIYTDSRTEKRIRLLVKANVPPFSFIIIFSFGES